MTTVATISFFFLILHLSASTTTAVSTTAHHDDHAPSRLVDRVCKSLEFEGSTYADCVAALAVDPRTASASKAKALAKIALEVAEANTTKSKEYIEKLARSTNGTTSHSSSLKSVLEGCATEYDSGAKCFHSALLEIDEDPMTANYDALRASDCANSCEDDLKSHGLHVPSVTSRNKHLMLFSDIGFVITGMLYS